MAGSNQQPDQHENGSRPPADPGIAAARERELLATEDDQTSADSDQTLSDTDQTSSDRDQTSADCDQVAADRDQAASDRDLAAGVDPHEHEITSDIRERTTHQREQTARVRLDSASDRDAVARARDHAALGRDQAADARDLEMAQRDAAYQQAGGRADFGMQIVERAAEHRRRAAEYRAQAAEHRVLAAEDRRAAAEDREQATAERLHARADRETSATELEIAETDPLTGARTRAAGLTDLEHEVDRCRRTDAALMIAYVDVVGLEDLNDNVGRDAGDELLRGVAALFKAHLRSYDLIVRLGGDAFLCAMSNISESGAHQRFSVIASELAAKPDARGIRAGFAALRSEETAEQLIARAVGELTSGVTY
jgi:diguanylate cyclase (GGDEF)-like protein